MKSCSTRPLRRYMMEFGGAMASYIGVLIGVVASRPHEGAANYLELLPAIPLFLALGALILGTGIMVWGFAENAGLPKLSTMWIAPSFCLCFGAYTLGHMPAYHHSAL